MCRILYYPEIVFRGNGNDFVHIAWLAGKMHRNDGLCSRGNSLGDFLGIDIKAVLFHVHKNRSGSRMQNDFGSSRERVRRGDDFVSGTNVAGYQRQMQARRARVNRNRAMRIYIGGELLFE